MSHNLSLSIALSDESISKPIINGEIDPAGVDLTVVMDHQDRLYRQHRRVEVDLAEQNITEYFRARQHGHRIIALPVFPHRRFRHGYLFIATNSGITKATDLIGRKIGITGRAPAAGVWVRGILQDFFDLPMDKVEWVENPLEPMDGPDYGKAVFVDNLTEDSLIRGDVDCLTGPGFIPGIRRHDPRVARLFPNWRELEREYWEETKIFPIMHVLTIHEHILAEHPWLGSSICEAFQKSKQLAYSRSAAMHAAPIAFIEHVIEDQGEFLGPDPWEYGLSARNRNNIETAWRYTKEQGRITGDLDYSEYFYDIDETIFHPPSGV